MFTGQLAAVLDHAADVEALELDDVPPTAHPYPLKNVFRPDVVSASVDPDEVLSAAPGSRTAGSGCRRSSVRRPDVVLPVGP